MDFASSESLLFSDIQNRKSNEQQQQLKATMLTWWRIHFSIVFIRYNNWHRLYVGAVPLPLAPGMPFLSHQILIWSIHDFCPEACILLLREQLVKSIVYWIRLFYHFMFGLFGDVFCTHSHIHCTLFLLLRLWQTRLKNRYVPKLCWFFRIKLLKNTMSFKFIILYKVPNLVKHNVIKVLCTFFVQAQNAILHR